MNGKICMCSSKVVLSLHPETDGGSGVWMVVQNKQAAVEGDSGSRWRERWE